MTTGLPEGWAGPTYRPRLRELERLRDHPHRFFLDLRESHGDVVWLGSGRWRAVFASHPDHVRHVLVDGHRVYRKETFQYRLLRRITGDGLLVSEGDEWRERRRIQQPAFHPDTLAVTTTATIRATDRMLRRWAALAPGAEIDVGEEMFGVALDVVLDALFGADPTGHEAELIRTTEDVLHYIVHRSRRPFVPEWVEPRRRGRFRRALRNLDRYIAEIVTERRRSRRGAYASPEHLLDRLLDASTGDAGTLTPVDVRNEMLTMLIAGHETVASGLSWALWLVAQSPETDAAIHDESVDQDPSLPSDPSSLSRRSQTLAAFSEALRLYPPAWMVTRRSSHQDGSGRWLPPRTLVLLSPFVTHRHPGFWTDPHTFDPGRFRERPAPHSYFPFGSGPRLCIGRDFALVEAVTVLSMISRRFRLTPVRREVEEQPGVTLQPAGGLRMRLFSRGKE